MVSSRGVFAAHNWYDTPHLYDLVFRGGTAEETAFLLAAADAYGLKKKRQRVLEPACGSGRLLESLGALGHSVFGFDLNEHMVAHASARMAVGAAAEARSAVWCADMATFTSPETVTLAHCLVSTFKYLLTEKEAAQHLRGVATALEPGGIYVLGMHLSDYADQRKSRERWFGREGKTHVVCNIQSWPADRTTRTEQVRSRLSVIQGKKKQYLESCWPFRTYSAGQLKSLLRSVPQFEHIKTFDFGYQIDSPRKLDDSQLDCVLILRKR